MQSVNQRGGSRATGSRSERLSYCPVILLLLGQAWAQSVLTDFHTLDKMCNAKTESNCTENPVEHLDLEDNVLDHLLFGLNKCLFSNGFWGLPLLFKTRPGLSITMSHGSPLWYFQLQWFLLHLPLAFSGGRQARTCAEVSLQPSPTLLPTGCSIFRGICDILLFSLDLRL